MTTDADAGVVAAQDPGTPPGGRFGPFESGRLGDLTGERERLLRPAGPGLDAGLDPDLDAGLDPGTAAAFLATLPAARFASHAYAGRGGRPFLQPRGGFPDLPEQRALTVALARAGADFLPLTIDSHTRHNDHDTATRLLAEGRATGRDLLNGFPLISHGVAATRELYRDLDLPVSLRHGTPDARLLAEYALAAGITEVEGGGLCYTLPYAKSFPLDRALAHWQYVDRLCALTGPPGLPVHRESFGPLTATLVPPVITIAVQLCELLLAAEQGVRSFAVSYGQTGSFEQDIAIARVLRDQAARLLAAVGADDVRVRLVFHQWMGAFPADPALAWPLIAVSTAIARLAGADKVVVKTPEEALGIPGIESNAAAVRAVRYVLDMFPASRPVSGEVIEEEVELIGAEVTEVMDHLLGQRAGSLLAAVHRAVLDGVLDVPFAPHQQNAGALLTDRAPDRRIRVLAPGRVPISGALVRRERELLGEPGPERGPLWERLLRDVRILA